MCTLSANKNDVLTRQKPIFVQAIDLPKTSFYPIAPNSIAELHADRNTHPVFPAAVSTAIDRYHRMCSGLASAI